MMKTNVIKRTVGTLLWIAVLLSVISCFGCAKIENPVEQSVTFVADGASDYVILYPNGSSSDLIRIAEQLRNAIKEKTGVELPISEVGKRTETGKEILIGEMEERSVTLEIGKTVRTDDYVIKVEDERLIVIGGTETKMMMAVRKFINETVNTIEGTTLTLPVGELVRINGTYPVSELKIGGVDISEYQIVYSAFRQDFYTAAVEAFQNQIQLLCGVRIKAVSSKAPETEHEIQFGDCGRGASKGLTAAKSQYALIGDGKSVAFVASDALTAEWGAKTLLEKHFPLSLSGTVEVSVPTEKTEGKPEIGKKLTDGADLRIMSSNMLFPGTQNGQERAKLLKAIYMEYCPDVIGLQECDSTGHSSVVNQLSFYQVACRVADGSTTKSYTPILYRPDHCQLLDSGCYQFDQQAMGSATKYLSWAVFKHLNTGKTFAVINVHAAIVTASIVERYAEQGQDVSNSVEGVAWRNDNSRQILERFDTLLQTYGNDLPVFIMGDMNATVKAQSIKMLDERPELGNCIDLAKVSKTTGTDSWHTLGKYPENSYGGLPIDHMFVTKDTVQVYTHYLNTSTDALKASDHCQLICEFAWKS